MAIKRDEDTIVFVPTTSSPDEYECTSPDFHAIHRMLQALVGVKIIRGIMYWERGWAQCIKVDARDGYGNH